jgi:hypothetical protein
MSNGEKIRIEFDRIFIYKSAQKASQTIVELGYAPDTETINLDISFEAFDEKYQANRKAWKEYWAGQHNSLY